MVNAAEARARQAANETQKKYDSYKNSAAENLGKARETAEDAYKDGRMHAEKKSEQAKEGWFSWLRWGQSKTDEAKKELSEKVEQVKSR